MNQVISVVGIDPSLRNFGIVKAKLDLITMTFEVSSMSLISSEDNAAKLKTVRKNSDDLRRASLLQRGLMQACEGASFAFVEVPIGSQSARAMAGYGICIGVLSSCPVPMVQVTPTEVKLAGTNIRTATKGEMIDAAVMAHPAAPWLTRKLHGEVTLLSANEHLADALFAIEAGIRTDEFRTTAAMLKGMRGFRSA